LKNENGSKQRIITRQDKADLKDEKATAADLEATTEEADLEAMIDAEALVADTAEATVVDLAVDARVLADLAKDEALTMEIELADNPQAEEALMGQEENFKSDLYKKKSKSNIYNCKVKGNT